MKKIKKFKIDGILTLSLYIDNVWIMDCEVSSQLSEREIREIYKEYVKK